MPIVAGTGYYTQPFYPPVIARWSEDQIAQELVRQTQAEAIGAFGEIGTWDAMTPDERKVFRAVGKAHLATNLPIFTHTNMGKSAQEQLDVLESVGVKPDRVAIGHLGGVTDPKAELQKAHLQARRIRRFRPPGRGGRRRSDTGRAGAARSRLRRQAPVLVRFLVCLGSQAQRWRGVRHERDGIRTQAAQSRRAAKHPPWDSGGQSTPLAGVHPEAAAGA